MPRLSVPRLRAAPRPASAGGPAPPVAGDHFAILDPLRAVAALSLVLYHTASVSDFGIVEDFVARLDVGVTLFFAISGFLLYRPFAKAHVLGDPRPASGPFAWRRFLRIVPGYWVALTVGALWFGRGEMLDQQEAAYYGFGQIYRPETILGGIGPAWSLCVEVAFYAFVPVWAWLITRRPASTRRSRLRREWWGLLALVVVSAAYKELFSFSDAQRRFDQSFAWRTAFPRFFDHFAIGMALAVGSVAQQAGHTSLLLRRIERRPGRVAALAVVPLWLAATQIGLGGPPRLGQAFTSSQDWVQHYLYALVALAVMTPAVLARPQGAIGRALTTPWLVWVGMVSYGVYLWHTLVIRQLSALELPEAVASSSGLPMAAVWFVMTLVPTLALAALSWYVIEQPALTLKTLVRSHSGGSARWPAAVVAAAAVVLVFTVLTGPVFRVLDATLCIMTLATMALLVPRIGRALRHRGVSAARALPAAAIVVLALAIVRLAAAEGGDPRRVIAAKGSPVHLASTFDGERLVLYVDGQPVASEPVSGRPLPATAPIEIGAYLGAGGWSGTIDEVAVYDRPLTSATLAGHAQDGRGGVGDYGDRIRRSRDVVGYWRLDDQDLEPAADATGGRDGVYGPGVLRGVPGLISGAGNRAAYFDGSGARIQTPALPSGRGGQFTLEAWVASNAVGNRHVINQAGGWRLKSDDFGRWVAEVDVGGVSIAAASAQGAISGVRVITSEQALLAALAACALAAGALAGVRSRGSDRPEPTHPATPAPMSGAPAHPAVVRDPA